MHTSFALAAALFATMCAMTANAQSTTPEPKPRIGRIKIATIGAPDLAKVEQWYTTYLGYQIHERGKVSAAVAESWGAPKSAGHAFITMNSTGTPDVLIRAVAIDAMPGYKPMTTLGWNAFEIITDDLDKVNAQMKSSPFTIIGEPRSLGGRFASIHAMQVVGPAGEVLYLTTETGNRETSNLPIPKAPVDRPFVIILAGHDVAQLMDFYGNGFHMKPFPRFDGPLELAAKAQGLPPDHVFQLSLVRAGERGNTIELDGYPDSALARPHAPGQLPQGNSFATFSVDSLDGLDVKFIKPPAPLYGKLRAASFIGPAGEITELIEEPRP